MKKNSLNILAWKKLRKDKLSFLALIFIIVCVMLGVFAVILSTDSSPMANEMHIELATQKPFTKVLFLDIPKKDINKVSFIEGVFIGKPTSVNRIPIDKYTAIQNGITYFPYESEFKQTFVGNYKISSQTFYFGSDKYGRDLLSRVLHGIRISLSVGFIAVFLSLFIGISLGLIAGYFRGKTDDIIMWFINVI